MTGIRSRIRALEEKLEIRDPIIIRINRIITDDGKTGEVQIRRIKYNSDGTVEHLGEEVRDWQEVENP
ncbi:MAG: hypothetical protein ACM3SR_08025 [Ignavibacteriales bacterium]